MTQQTSWDRKEAKLLRDQGLSQDQIGFVLGRLAEHRMLEDRKGYERGYNQGVLDGENRGKLKNLSD